ncbi:MAG: twin-arginine translocation signal domain-containing protein, partial [Acidimicrobiales bacterium]|nr:twin-arginine translocation signal domain-containing protein [Acidimicrobiales bacterium]
MTFALRPRRTNREDSPVGVEPAADLTGHGIHRDPALPDPIASGGLSQRLVHRISSAMGRRTTSRRSFLTRTAVVGSALAVGPLDFI